jgi:uncharacterized protein (DUF1800 family)
VRAGDSQPFTATVTGTTTTGVTWSVNGMPGGNATVGTIDASGGYKAPDSLPSPSNVTVQATSVVQPSATGTSNVTLLNPVPVLTNVNPRNIGVGAVTLTATGSRFANGATILFGNTALTTTFVSSTQLTATFLAGGLAGAVPVTVQNPDPGAATSSAINAQLFTTAVVPKEVAARFLEQATFGPTRDLINQVQQVGFLNFLQDQFDAPVSTYADPAPSENSLTPTQQRFFTNVLNGQDQLRQRLSFGLSEIWVISGNTIVPQGVAPYLRLLQQDALANYRTIMQDVTLSPAMGRYLDMVNNDKPDPVANTHANENYARELLQLFTVGTYLLNSDGSLQRDAQGNPLPTYDESVVQGFARAYTGWTYPTQAGATLQKHNPLFYLGPMEAFENNHDTNSKAILGGVVLPAGQTSLADLNGALDTIFNHPNVGPFVCKQLIQHLVTSNPSPAYVTRVAGVFASGSFNGLGSGQRGDMKAVIAAILLDAEARRGDVPVIANPADGHLREPIIFIAGLLRAFGATSDGSALISQGGNMGQTALQPPSVFNFFPPDFKIPGSSPALLGPEFALQTAATDFARINFVNTFAFGTLGGTTVDFTSYANLAANPNQLLDSLNTSLLHGTMSSDMQTSITNALNAVPSGSSQALQRAKTAIYLVGSSSQYQVHH